MSKKKNLNCLDKDSNYFIKEKRKQIIRPEWNEYVYELHTGAKEAVHSWVLAGKIRHGPEFEQKEKANAKFKYAVHFIKRNEQMLRANSMGRKMLQNDVYSCVSIQGQHPSRTHPSPPAKAGSFRETCRPRQPVVKWDSLAFEAQ